MKSKFSKAFYIKGLFVAIFSILLFTFISSANINVAHAVVKCPSDRPNQASDTADYLICCATAAGDDCKPYYKNVSSNVQSPNTNTVNIKKATEEEIDKIATALESDNNSCPEPLKQRYLDIINSGADLYANGTTIVAYDGNTPVVMSCANASVLNKFVIRGIMLLFGLIGIALAFAVGRAAIMMITSFANPDQWETGLKSLIISFMYTIGLIFFYTLFIFVTVNVLGIGASSTRQEFNLFCSNRIIINITFDQNGNC